MTNGIQINQIKPIQVEAGDKVVYATHEILAEGESGLYLITDYEQEQPTLYVAQLKEDEMLHRVSDELEEEIAEYISKVTIPNFPSYETTLEEINNGTL